jgi:hypothetical protein
MTPLEIFVRSKATYQTVALVYYWCSRGLDAFPPLFGFPLFAGFSLGWPTGLEPAPFGATIRRPLFLEVAVGCKIGLSKPISLLVVARRCSVLRVEWCQMASPAPCVPMSLSTPRTSSRPP